VRGRAGRERARDHEPDRERADRAEIRPQAPQRSGERRDVEERWQDDEEDQVRVDLDARGAGHEPEGEPADHEEDRIGDAEPSRDRDQRGDRDQQSQDELGALHGSRSLAHASRAGPRWYPASSMAGTAERNEAMFPRLTAAQLERLRPLGRPRRFAAAETIYERGVAKRAFYVLLEGRVEIASLSRVGEERNTGPRGGGVPGQGDKDAGRYRPGQAEAPRPGTPLEIRPGGPRHIV